MRGAQPGAGGGGGSEPGPGLGPEMYERQYSGLPPDLLELHKHHIVPYTFCKIQIYIDEKFSSVLMSCHN